eukprot:m.74686 g.74686  ORF g.74686 m.74686 type:complete len:237 (+) comp14526_c0_seq1:260-970(+)
MKLLDNTNFTRLSRVISGVHVNVRLDCKLDSYSCKMAGADKKLFKQITQEGKPDEFEALSPAVSSMSPGADLSSSLPEDGMLPACSRKTLYYLKATLNTAFAPDYEFGQALSHEFSREDRLDRVLQIIASNLHSAMGEDYTNISDTLWKAINEEINPNECDIYSYNPDADSDPFVEEGSLWSFNFFFFNKKLKRIVFFACRAASLSSHMEDDDRDSMDEDDDVFPYEDDESSSNAY